MSKIVAQKHDGQPDVAQYRRVAKYPGPVGLKGDVKLVAEPSYSDWLPKQRDFLLTAPKLASHYWSLRFSKITHLSDRTYRARFAGINSRNDLEALQLPKGALWLPIDVIPRLEDGEFWLDDLVGLTLVTDEGNPIGKVTAWLDGSGDTYLDVESTDGKSSATIPFTEHFFPTVDIKHQHIVTHPTVEALLSEA